MYEKVEDLGELWATTDRFGETRVGEKFAPTMKARMACALIEKWGMIACDPASGEDRAGRARLRLLRPGEVVDRAVETAELAVEHMRDLGWFTAVPAPKEKPRD